ncbi:MAG: hypothetical protein E2O68_07840 [Deltaproteobacteria bacterium]|nr:MAG: hypothetical protein E2O68_07840 [Deltaproteobacteria bacterium]
MARILFLILLCSCSFYSTKETFSLSSYSAKEKNDYIDQLASLAGVYVKSPEVYLIKLSKGSKRYLKKIYKRIRDSNELLFTSRPGAKFFIIKSRIPFHFSLPKGNFFFSSALVKKFLDTEELLVSVLAFEMIKSNRNIYPKNIVVPTGYIGTSRMLDLTYIPFEAKVELDKWAFRSLRRAGYDPASYLLWLQTQNKNSLEFGRQLRGRNISREEYSLKNFLVKEGNEGNNNEEGDRNSTPGYYQLIKEIKAKDS